VSEAVENFLILILLTSTTRVLRVFQSDTAAVAKLFAKHIRLAESIAFVKKTRYVHKHLDILVCS
jgi:hypothetical protein